MNIDLFDDPLEGPRAPRDVRINRIGIYVYEDRRRIAVGFNLTPFRQRPSVEVLVHNSRGEAAGSLSIIEAIQPNFTLTVHLRDREPTDTYSARVRVYYNVDEQGAVQQLVPPAPLPPRDASTPPSPPPREELAQGRLTVDERQITFDVTEVGEK
jgi:hypothetical protein